MIKEFREVLEKHKDNMPVVATAELLAVIEEAEKLPAGVCIGCPCWKTDGTCMKDDMK